MILKGPNRAPLIQYFPFGRKSGRPVSNLSAPQNILVNWSFYSLRVLRLPYAMVYAQTSTCTLTLTLSIIMGRMDAALESGLCANLLVP
jgi:hypothetical protein